MHKFLQLAAFLGTLYFVFFLFERVRPLRVQNVPVGRRLLINAVMSALSFSTSALLVQPAVRLLLDLGGQGQVGVVPRLGLPPWLEVGLTFLLLDLSFYYWHRASHEISWLWRFHKVHHIDHDVDVSTGFRFHPGEIALSAVFRVIQISVIGAGGGVYALYEAVFQAATLFHHSNVRLPIAVERALNFLFVTPRMHGLHHSAIAAEANSNYSVVLSIWDRIHGSMTSMLKPQPQIGVAGYGAHKENELSNLLAVPFLAPKDNPS